MPQVPLNGTVLEKPEQSATPIICDELLHFEKPVNGARTGVICSLIIQPLCYRNLNTSGVSLKVKLANVRVQEMSPRLSVSTNRS